MVSLSVIEHIAETLLAFELDPVPKYLLLRDVLRADASRLVEAKNNLFRSHWFKELQQSQSPDGSWGRFHSEDTHQSRQKYRTTESAIRRCHVIGLQHDDPVLCQAIQHMEAVLEGRQAIIDPPEKNDRWEAGVEMFVAGTLAMVDPTNPLLEQIWRKWKYIAEKAFASGRYNLEAEKRIHYELHGITSELRYLELSNKYALYILSAKQNIMSEAAEQALLSWLLQLKEGIGYFLDTCLQQTPGKIPFRQADTWLRSLELLMRFPLWKGYFSHIVDWLWEQKDEENLWDFGPRLGDNVEVPLSESWRKKGTRKIDYTVKVLTLLRQACEEMTR